MTCSPLAADITYYLATHYCDASGGCPGTREHRGTDQRARALGSQKGAPTPLLSRAPRPN